MTGWIEALKELTRKLPTQDEIELLSEQVIAEKNDRGAALISGTITEDTLRAFLKTVLVPLSKTELEALFDRDAPFSSFSKLIRVTHAFGLIDADMKRDLNRIREIRNVFAHALIPVGFETPAIAEACKGFYKPGLDYTDIPFPADHPRTQYINANGRLMRVLNVGLMGVKKLPLTFADDPGPQQT